MLEKFCKGYLQIFCTVQFNRLVVSPSTKLLRAWNLLLQEKLLLNASKLRLDYVQFFQISLSGNS